MIEPLVVYEHISWQSIKYSILMKLAGFVNGIYFPLLIYVWNLISIEQVFTKENYHYKPHRTQYGGDIPGLQSKHNH